MRSTPRDEITLISFQESGLFVARHIKCATSFDGPFGKASCLDDSPGGGRLLVVAADHTDISPRGHASGNA